MQWQVPLLMQIKYCIILLKAVKTIFQKKIYYRCLSFFQMQLWGELTSLNSRLNVVIGRNSTCNYQSALFQEILAITMPQDAQIFKRSWLVKGWANDWYLSSPLRIGFFFVKIEMLIYSPLHRIRLFGKEVVSLLYCTDLTN